MTELAKTGVFAEDPRNIGTFCVEVAKLPWAERDEALKQLFTQVECLAARDLRYVFRRRRTRAVVSFVTRLCGWLLGTAGVLCPLVAKLQTPPAPLLDQWALIALAAAGSAFAANALFGGTDGHVRFMRAQIALEGLIVARRLAWAELLASPDRDEVTAFKQITDYAAAISEFSLREADGWGAATLAELSKYGAKVEKKPAGDQK